MKNFKMKQVSLSKTTDFKIRMKLAFTGFQKNVQGVKILQLTIPALLLGMITVGIFQNTGNPNSLKSGENISLGNPTRMLNGLTEVRSNSYKLRAQRRVRAKKVARYKQYAYVRGATLRNK